MYLKVLATVKLCQQNMFIKINTCILKYNIVNYTTFSITFFNSLIILLIFKDFIVINAVL